MEKNHPSLAAQLMQRYNSGRTSHQTQDGVVVETGAVHGKAKKGAQGGNLGGAQEGEQRGWAQGRPRGGERGTPNLGGTREAQGRGHREGRPGRDPGGVGPRYQ